MRRVLVPLLLALAAAPAAAAGSAPPPKLVTIHLRTVHLTPLRHAGSASCSARAHARTGAIARRLRPVACEQPPRSRLGLNPAKQAAAAAVAALAP